MNIDVADQLNTDRLLLREMNPVIYKKVIGTFEDDAIKKYFGYETEEQLKYEKERFYQGLTMAGRSFLYFQLIEKKSLKVIGWCGFHTWFLKHRRAEIGYELFDNEYKNKGFMKEALGPVLKYGFEKMNLFRIEALLSPENIPSKRLVQFYGFTEEGLLRSHYCKDDVLEDSAIYSILKPEFEGR